MTRPSRSGDRRVSYPLSVPSACRLWAGSRHVPLRDLLQQFVVVGAHLVETLPPTVRHLPSAVDLLAAASVPRDAETVLLSPAGDGSALPPCGVPRPGVPPSAVAAEPRVDDDDALVLRLRSYAMSCRAVHPDLDAPQLVYMVVAYAIALGVPAESAAAPAEAAFASAAPAPECPVPGSGGAA